MDLFYKLLERHNELRNSNLLIHTTHIPNYSYLG